jgi:hypothetical protein
MGNRFEVFAFCGKDGGEMKKDWWNPKAADGKPDISRVVGFANKYDHTCGDCGEVKKYDLQLVLEQILTRRRFLFIREKWGWVPKSLCRKCMKKRKDNGVLFLNVDKYSSKWLSK